MLRVLDAEAEAQLAQTRDLLAALRDALIHAGMSGSDLGALAASMRQLDDPFLLVIVGEFNAGKSAFINALLGQVVVQEGVTPTTAQIHLLCYGDTVTRGISPDGIQTVTAPVDLLRDVHIVDTPGTNAIIREHERLTTDFVPRSDLVLFVTAGDRPFTETERLFLAAIRGWGKKIVMVLNKVDIFGTRAELEEVLAFVKKGVRDLLGIEPTVLPVSARLAQQAQRGEPAMWAVSGFEAVDHYLRETLDVPGRFRLKLTNPLGVGKSLATRYAEIATNRLELIGDDRQLLAGIERQLVEYRDDTARGFGLRMTAVEKELADMEARGHRFFDDTLRIGRVIDLLNRARVQKEFEETVIADAPVQIERRVTEMIHWLVDQDFRQWRALTGTLLEAHRKHQARPFQPPGVVEDFVDHRARVIESIGREAQRVVDTYDKRREAEVIADQARTAVAAAAATGGAAVGLGTLVTIAATTVAADVTGILLASVMLGIGFLIIPARRRRAKSTLQEKVGALRARLSSALSSEFERVRAQSEHRFTDAVAPFAQFVRAEERRWTEGQQTLTQLRDRIAAFLTRLTADDARGRS